MKIIDIESQIKVRIHHLEATQKKENKANSYIIVEEEKINDVSSPNHALRPAFRRMSRDPTSRRNKDRNRDNIRTISQ